MCIFKHVYYGLTIQFGLKIEKICLAEFQITSLKFHPMFHYFRYEGEAKPYVPEPYKPPHKPVHYNPAPAPYHEPAPYPYAN